jgi:hypothetical protein
MRRRRVSVQCEVVVTHRQGQARKSGARLSKEIVGQSIASAMSLLRAAARGHAAAAPSSMMKSRRLVDEPSCRGPHPSISLGLCISAKYAAHVGDGSTASVSARVTKVRPPPQSGARADIPRLRVCATSRREYWHRAAKKVLVDHPRSFHQPSLRTQIILCQRSSPQSERCIRPRYNKQRGPVIGQLQPCATATLHRRR